MNVKNLAIQKRNQIQQKRKDKVHRKQDRQNRQKNRRDVIINKIKQALSDYSIDDINPETIKINTPTPTYVKVTIDPILISFGYEAIPKLKTSPKKFVDDFSDFLAQGNNI